MPDEAININRIAELLGYCPICFAEALQYKVRFFKTVEEIKEKYDGKVSKGTWKVWGGQPINRIKICKYHNTRKSLPELVLFIEDYENYHNLMQYLRS